MTWWEFICISVVITLLLAAVPVEDRLGDEFDPWDGYEEGES